MKLLLDTHAVLWCLTDPSQLGPDARALLQKRSQPAWFSVISLWELAIKVSIGKLTLDRDLVSLNSELQKAALQRLPLEAVHCEAVQGLPFHHRDPFDRMLVGQAIAEGMSIVSKDPQLDLYGVQRVW